MKENHLKNILTPAPDNALIETFFIYKTDGVYWVSFYDKNDNIIIHNVDMITPDNVYRARYEQREWAQLVATTKWGATRIVKKFLAGKIKDFKKPIRPLP